MARKAVRPVHTLSGLPSRLLSTALAVLLRRRMGRPVLQPRPQLLHEPQAVQERRHLLQHGPRLVHLHVPARVYRHRLRAGQRRLQRGRMPQRRCLHGKWRTKALSNGGPISNRCLIEDGRQLDVFVPTWLPRTALRDIDSVNLRRPSVSPRCHLRGRGRGLPVPVPRRLRRC